MKRWWCIFGIIPILDIAADVIRVTETCPEMCICQNYVTDCQNTDLSELPTGIDEFVESLDLSMNNFVKIPKQINLYVRLKYLNISYNKIATLGHMDFDNLVNLEKLDLSFNNFHDWKDIHSQAFANLKNVNFIDFSHNPVRTLPLSSNHFSVKSLEILKLNNCSLVSIPAGFLKAIPNLLEFHVANNPTSNIKGNFSSKALRHIDLSGCSLNSISDSAFKGLETLQYLNLNKNKNLRNVTINSETLLNLEISESLLDTTPYGNMRSLTNLNLHGNILRELKNNIFINIPNLIYLNLSLNAITLIAENAFKSLEDVKVIDLSFNKLSEIKKHTFFITKSLFRLDLSHNYLSSIDTISSESLNVLDASYCEINYITKRTLSNLPQLSYLSLKRNFITSIPDGWSAQKLLSLDLSDCRIKSITNKTFTQMPYLRELDLSSNRLTTIHYSYFPPNILVISIRDNLWRCDCPALKDTYDWLQLHSSFVDDLVCDSPDNVDGQTWLAACQNQWYPSMNKKDHLWWYSVALLISMLLLLVTVVALRKLNEMREKRYREMEERRRQQERETRETLQRMQQIHREYREEVSRNAPDPRESQGPPSYNDALLLPRLNSSQPSLAGSLHSFGSRGSLHGSNPEVNKKGKVRRKKRRRRSESRERTPVRHTEDSNESESEQRDRPLESDF